MNLAKYLRTSCQILSHGIPVAIIQPLKEQIPEPKIVVEQIEDKYQEPTIKPLFDPDKLKKFEVLKNMTFKSKPKKVDTGWEEIGRCEKCFKNGLGIREVSWEDTSDSYKMVICHSCFNRLNSEVTKLGGKIL